MASPSWRAARRAVSIAAVYYHRARSHAEPLRRTRPSRRRAPHHRQPDARLAADRRGVAAAAPPAECAAGAGGRVVPDRRSAVAISIAAFAVAVGAIASIVLRSPARRWAGVAGAAVFAFNPNVLYLQATPMTEPLLLGLTTLAVAMLLAWCTRLADTRRVGRSGRMGRSRWPA